MNTASASATGTFRSVVKSSRLALTLEATSTSSPGSKIGIAPVQACDLAVVLVHARDLVAEIRKTGAGHQPHIARANHGNPHEETRLSWLTRPPLKTFRRSRESGKRHSP